MFANKSRYVRSQIFNQQETSRFRGVLPRAIGPAEGVIEHTLRTGDRLDLLARHYYNDDRLWWRIVDANPEFRFGGDMFLDDMAGTVILIPRSKE